MARDGRNSALLTDLYELTMAAAYFECGLRGAAGFEMFVRELPPSRSYLVCAGLEQAVSYLENLHFTAAQIDYLRSQPVFKDVSDGFWRYLSGFRFTGSVWAMPEGSLAFPGEPLLTIRGPIIEAQIVETFLLTTLNYQTLVATKAARASYIGGCAATSNVEAGFRMGIPVSGTQAHSFVMAFEREEDAFRSYYKSFPDACILLIDT